MDIQIEKGQSVATTRLYDAALLGDIPFLLDLLKEDPFILERCIIEKSTNIKQSPLHVAVAMGHLEFVVELLRREPKLDEMVDNLKGSSPLHIASAKGHLQIIDALIGKKPHMCFARDQDGRTPTIVAAVYGQIDVLELLHRANPYAAQGRTNDGETILHLCVIRNQLKVLEHLLELVDDDGNQLINSGDNNSNTVLHLAVIGKQSEMVEYLAGYQGLNKNATNKNKMTAVDILIEQKRRKSENWNTIQQYLKRAKARPAMEVRKHETDDSVTLEEQRTSYMVVASLIATMAFGIGVNPPGGVWQDTKIEKQLYKGENLTHYAGTAVWSYKTGYVVHRNFDDLLISNTIGLISSLSVILLLISGLPFKRHFLLILRIILWIAVTATTYTYFLAVTIVVWEGNNTFLNTISFSFLAWAGLIGTILFGHFVRFIFKLIGWERRQNLKECCKSCFPRITNTTTDRKNLSNRV